MPGSATTSAMALSRDAVERACSRDAFSALAARDAFAATAWRGVQHNASDLVAATARTHAGGHVQSLPLYDKRQMRQRAINTPPKGNPPISVKLKSIP